MKKYPKSFLDKLNSVTAKRPKTIIQHILEHGFVTTEELEQMMSANDVDFEKLAQEKFALFILQSDCDRSMDGLVNLFISQAINALPLNGIRG